MQVQFNLACQVSRSIGESSPTLVLMIPNAYLEQLDLLDMLLQGHVCV